MIVIHLISTSSECEIWPCIFGCAGESDTLCHYLRCSKFWSSLSAAGLSVDAFSHADPLEIVCLTQPTSRRLNLIAVASRCYHTIKLSHRNVVETAIASQNVVPVHTLCRDLAKLFANELGVT